MKKKRNNKMPPIYWPDVVVWTFVCVSAATGLAVALFNLFK
jgi:hypothetical protein